MTPWGEVRRLARLAAAAASAVSLIAAGARDPLQAAYDARSAVLLASYGERLLTHDDVKFTGYDTIAWTALHGCGPPAVADKMVDTVRPDLVAKSVDKAAYAFVLPPIVRYVFQDTRCLSAGQTARLRQWLATPQQLFSYGTTNHTLMSSTSFYLLAQRYPDLAWKGADGRSHGSAEVMSRYRALLLARLRKTLAEGFDEQLSPTYAMADLYPLVNLIDFAADPAMRKAAEAAAVAQIATLRSDSFGGAVVAPFNRETGDQPQLNDNPDTNARDLLWLYFGDGGFPGRSVEPAYASLLATANWRPPPALLAMRGRDGPAHEVATRTPGFTIWDRPSHTQMVGSALITSDFALGVGNIAEDPTHPNASSVAFEVVLRGRRPTGVVQCYQPFWRSDTGEDAWSGDLSSPFQQAWRAGERAVLLYDMPSSDPLPAGTAQFAHLREVHAGTLLRVVKCRLPSPPDEIATDSTGVAARYGEVMVALRALGAPMAPAKSAAPGFLEYRIHAARSALYVRITRRAAGESLDAFRRAVWAAPVRYDPAASAIRFADASGRTVEVTFNRDRTLHEGVLSSLPTVWIDGKPPPAAAR